MIGNFTEVKPLRYWVQHILPLVYDDSLSYMELLGKVVNTLNEVVKNNNLLPDYIMELIKEYISSGEIKKVLAEVLSNYMLNVKFPPAGLKPATGDGSADDTEAIQGCIDYAFNNGGMSVYFPSGSYLTQPLTLSNKATLFGQDRYTTRLVMKGGATTAMFTGDVDELTLSGLGFDGNMDIQVNNVNLFEISVNSAIISNCLLTDGYDLLNITVNNDLQLSNLLFRHSVENALVLNGAGIVQGENLIFKSVSTLVGKNFVVMGVSKSILEQVKCYGASPNGVLITGDNNVVKMWNEQSLTPYVDNGTNNSITVYTQSEVEKLTGSKTAIIGGNVTETITGNKEVSAHDITETATGTRTENTTGNRNETTSGNVTETITGDKEVSAHDITETATGTRTENTTGNRNETTSGNVTETITGDKEVSAHDITETATGTRTENTTGNRNETTSGNVTETITGDKEVSAHDITETATGTRTENTTGNRNETTSGNVTETITGDRAVSSQNYNETVRGNKTATANKSTENVTAEKDLNANVSRETLGTKTVNVSDVNTENSGSKNETITGDKTVNAANSTETIDGDKTVNAGVISNTAANITNHATQDLTEQVDGNKNITVFDLTFEKSKSKTLKTDNLFVDTVNPIKYSKPLTMNDYFDTVHMISTDDINYEVLVKTNKTEQLSGGYFVNVKDFGAKGDGINDDISAINSAIKSLPPGGGTVYFPSGIYMISSPIFIGNGQANSTPNGKVSDYNAIKLIGCSDTRVGTNSGTQITPSKNIGAVIQVLGAISNVELKRLQLYCDGKATFGLHITACINSTFENINIYNPTYCGIGLYGGKMPTGNYSINNYFKSIFVSLASSNTIGLDIDGIYKDGDIYVNNDIWLSIFEICRFQILKDAKNCTAAIFKYVDSITFKRCHFVTYDNTGRGIEFNAIGHNDYPAGIGFYDCSIINTVVTESETDKMRKCYFIGNGSLDQEVQPTNEKLIGITDSGIPFNGWGARTTTLINAGLDEPISVPDGTWDYLLTLVNFQTNTFAQLSGTAKNKAVVNSAKGVNKFLYCIKR
jgi:polygalacturonase